MSLSVSEHYDATHACVRLCFSQSLKIFRARKRLIPQELGVLMIKETISYANPMSIVSFSINTYNGTKSPSSSHEPTISKVINSALILRMRYRRTIRRGSRCLSITLILIKIAKARTDSLNAIKFTVQHITACSVFPR